MSSTNHKENETHTTEFTDWQLEQYVLNELEQSIINKIDQAKLNDDVLLNRINMIKQSNEELLIKLPAAKFLEKNNISSEKKSILKKESTIHSKSNLHNNRLFKQIFKTPDFSSLFSGMFPKLVASSFALAFVLIVLPTQNLFDHSIESGVINSDDAIRLKGLTPVLKVYKKNGAQLQDLERLKQGDVLQLSYIAGNALFAMIVSVDGNGVITEHLIDNKKSVSLNHDGEVALDFAYKLDNAPDFERFIMLGSNQEFDKELLIEKLKKLIESKQAKFGELKFENSSQDFYLNSITLNKNESKKMNVNLKGEK